MIFFSIIVTQNIIVQIKREQKTPFCFVLKGLIMKVTILGTGCIWTKRACASYLIDDDIIVDPGSGTLKQLFRSSNVLLHHEKIERIKLILITHYHIDHYFDIVHLMWKIASENNPHLSATIICPPGGKERIQMLCKLGMSESTFKKLNFDKYIKFVDASTLKNFQYRDYEITSYKMNHGDIDCYGYSFKERRGKTVSFTGDSAMCDSMMQLINNSDVAFVDMAGTDYSGKHYNIIDGINLMKEYRGKCCIVPCHLTSQALDYCQGRINPPKEMMTLNIADPLPYDYELKQKKEGVTKQDNFKFALKRLEKIAGKLVDLQLKKTKNGTENYKMPTYCFNVLQAGTDNVLGEITYSVVPNNIEGHADNVSFELKKDYDLRSVKYDCLLLIQKIAKKHKAKCLYLTCAPDDFDTRAVFESIGAYLKEIKTIVEYDAQNNRQNTEKSIWVWEF